jgi:hypothetical protein
MPDQEVSLDPSNLSSKEKKFLVSQSIDINEIYDARYERRYVWENKAREGNFDFILGSPCREFGHRLRTRSGHCIQCNTARIAYIRRESRSGQIYLAYSQEGESAKIGFCKRVDIREISLRTQGYGGYFDWRIVCSFRSQNGGYEERLISSIFRKRRMNGFYEKDNTIQSAREMYRYKMETAVKKFRKFARFDLNVTEFN